MNFFVRTTVGLGNSTVYARLRDRTGQFWNFVTLAWVTPETSQCRVFLTEYADSDTLESLYQAEASVPAGGPWIEEAVNVSDGSVIAFDDNVMGEMASVPVSSSGWLEKLNFVFQYLAFRRTATGSVETLYKEDEATSVGSASLSDDGTTFIKTKVS